MSLASFRRVAPAVNSMRNAGRVPLTRGGGWAVRPAAGVQRWLSTPATEAAAPTAAAATAAAAATPERHAFQAETRQLMDIVTNSLYTDKHVFIRELVSNASDALEKVRHMSVTGTSITAPSLPLEIRITTDEAAGTITISDTGVGMTKQELMDNLGTIARSGSRAFMQKVRESSTTDTGTNIIGQFGVGFYSAFMVCDSVRVLTQSALPDTPAYCWTSSGDGSYEISHAEGVTRGSHIIIKLKDSCKEFASANVVKDVLSRYSSFVSFPIILNDKTVNTVGAIWATNKADITEEQYTEFYKYKSGDFEPPLYRLHFTSDAPIALKALLFVGRSHEEKFGMQRMKPGVDLYSRRVLIETGSRLMPDWLRFVHGVVDSEDIPLNISRESMQDSALMKRLKNVITRRVLRFLDAEARRDATEYATKFFSEFGNFLKEGALTDPSYSADIAKLLRFESSALPAGTLTSFDEYVSRMPPGQSDVYYLVAPHRGLAETSPYMEAFKAAKGGADVEVLYMYSSLDDFVMNNLREYNGRKLMTAETANLDPHKLQGVTKEGDDAAAAAAAAETDAQAGKSADAPTPLTAAQVEELGKWWQALMPRRLSKVRTTKRLRTSPAVVTDHESAAMRRMIRMVEESAGRDSESLRGDAHMLPPQTLEINPSHPVITRLYSIKDTQPDLALIVAEQVVDNALVAAGLVEDSRVMLPRLNALLERLLQLPSSYTNNESITSRRFVSDKEKDEVAGIEASQRAMEEMLQKAAASAAADASAGAGASSRSSASAAAGAGAAGAGAADDAVSMEDLLAELQKTAAKEGLNLDTTLFSDTKKKQ